MDHSERVVSFSGMSASQAILKLEVRRLSRFEGLQHYPWLAQLPDIITRNIYGKAEIALSFLPWLSVLKSANSTRVWVKQSPCNYLYGESGKSQKYT